jgi:hypothetical protein
MSEKITLDVLESESVIELPERDEFNTFNTANFALIQNNANQGCQVTLLSCINRQLL